MGLNLKIHCNFGPICGALVQISEKKREITRAKNSTYSDCFSKLVYYIRDFCLEPFITHCPEPHSKIILANIKRVKSL